MRYIIIATILLFTSPVFAMNAIQQQLKETPEMTRQCVKKIAYYESKIGKYESIPKNKRKAVHKIKLNYYINELITWQRYCAGDKDEDSE